MVGSIQWASSTSISTGTLLASARSRSIGACNSWAFSWSGLSAAPRRPPSGAPISLSIWACDGADSPISGPIRRSSFWPRSSGVSVGTMPVTRSKYCTSG